MLLTIDCGNTNTVFGIWDGTDFVANWRCATQHQRTADEYYVWLRTLMGLHKLDVAITDCIVSSTVPRVVFNLRVLCDRYFDTRPYVVGKADTSLPVGVRVDAGTAVGPDRLVNTVAGFDRHGGDLIVVDFGTATTFDVVDTDGAYIGGVIAPGREPVARGAAHGGGSIAACGHHPAAEGSGHQHRRLHAVGHLLGLCRPHQGNHATHKG